jgi:HSP20 family molecular chaperone IbpA
MVQKVKSALSPHETPREPVAKDVQREGLSHRPVATPPVDAYESNDEWILRADVPGARPDNTTVWFDPREGLTVHVQPHPPLNGKDALFREYVPADWYYAVQLPDWLDGARAESSVANGVLTVRVPKQAHARTKSIPISFSN